MIVRSTAPVEIATPKISSAMRATWRRERR